MNDLEVKENSFPSIKEWNGQRVVTFKDIDKVHERKSGTARQSFNKHKKHFEEGVDYFLVKKTDLKEQSNVTNSYNEKIPPKGLTLITESGYLMAVKLFTDDKSWEVQKRLVKSYFRQKEAVQPPEAIDPICRPQSLMDAPLRPDGYRRNKDKMKAICEHNDITHKELYRYLLKNLGEIYDLEAAREIYKKEKGYYPKYAMDIVWHFPNLAEAADEMIDKLVSVS